METTEKQQLPTNPHDPTTIEYARHLDAQDPLREFRREFIIPSKAELKSKTLLQPTSSSSSSSSEEKDTTSSIYLCGNSLGLQPRQTSTMIQTHLSTWAQKGVYGHFVKVNDSPLPPFLHADEVVAKQMASVIVGAKPAEVAIMQTLTANLHLMMISFYRPTKSRFKVLFEGKAFPSDHYAVESQIRLHDLNPDDAMILINPPTSSSSSSSSSILTTQHILSVIDEHASSTALILLPGIQYYTGQYFDIPLITAHAHSRGICIGWDLAHAVGNVELRLHDWEVDFAVWCNYKYLNAGPGAIGALFVHERHTERRVDQDEDVGDDDDDDDVTTGGFYKAGYRRRLTGWWGGDKSIRFRMDNKFLPIPGAQGYQLSNPSILDLTSLHSSLSIFARATMSKIRQKSILLTGYLEHLLLQNTPSAQLFTIITPTDPSSRGAQLSIKLSPGLLERVMKHLEENGVVVDERKPDVVRVAPAALYNSFQDVWRFVEVFREALRCASSGGDGVSGAPRDDEMVDDDGEEDQEGSVMVNGGRMENGAWGGIK